MQSFLTTKTIIYLYNLLFANYLEDNEDVGNIFSYFFYQYHVYYRISRAAFDPSSVRYIQVEQLPGEQLGYRCLAQGQHGVWVWQGVEPEKKFWSQVGCPTTPSLYIFF